jgi:hypothetical protein
MGGNFNNHHIGNERGNSGGGGGRGGGGGGSGNSDGGERGERGGDMMSSSRGGGIQNRLNFNPQSESAQVESVPHKQV